MTASGPAVAQGSAKSNGHSANGSSAAPSNGPHFGGNGNGHGNATNSAIASAASTTVLERAGLLIAETAGSASARNEQFASFQTDAPSCDNCGAITVRNGNCYLCHNCGNSMGCS